MIDSTAKLHENRIHRFDTVRLTNDSHASRGIVARQSTRSSSNGDDGGSFPLTFGFRAKGDGGDPDASSPRLWKTPEPVSPNSRAEAIERGQRELMEMIKDLPESAYELSLRDIVEQDSSSQICRLPDRDSAESDDEKRPVLMADLRKRKKKAKKAIPLSRSFDSGGGYLLKTSVFPIWFGRKRKQNKKAGPSPEKDWWRRRSSGESDSSAGLSSSNSGSSSSSRSSSASSSRQGQSNKFLLGCCSFRKN